MRLLLFGLLGFCVAAVSEAAIPAAPATPLISGQTAAGKLAKQSSSFYSIELGAGTFARVEVRQVTGDVTVALKTAAGDLLRQVNATKAPDSELVDVISDGSPLSIEISGAADPVSEFTASITDTHPASPKEREQVAGEIALERADRLMNAGTAAALADSINTYNEARAHFRASGDRRREGVALDSLGWATDLSGDKRKALEVYNEALAARRDAGDRQGEAQTLEGIGLSLLYLGENDKALEINQQVLKLAREIGDRKTEFGVLHNMGGIYWSTDEMQKALEYYEQALPLERALKDRLSEATTLNNIGDVYRRLGDYDRAATYFGQALAIRREIGDRRGEATSLHTTALVHMANDDPAKALELFTKALEIRRAVGDKRGIAYSLGGSALALHALGKPDKALQYQDEAIALWKTIGEKRAEAETWQDRGFVLLDLKEYDKALQAFRTALPVSEETGDRTYQAKSLYGIARAERQQGKLAESKGDIEKALDIVESLRGRIASSDLRASYFASVSKFYEFYVDLLMQMHSLEPQAGYDRRAFEASERARARSLLDLLAEASVDTSEQIDPATAARQLELRKAIRAKDSLRIKLATTGKKEELAKIDVELEAAIAEYRDLSDRIRRSQPRYANLTEPKILSVEELQKILDRDAAVVSYALGEDRSWVWLITNQSITSAVLPARNEINDAARKLYAQLQSLAGATPEAVDAYWKSAQALTRMILSPVVKSALPEHLVVLGDSGLQYVPFAALADPLHQAKPLLTATNVVYLPSASVLPLLRSEGRASGSPGKLVAVFADPVFQKDDPRITSKQASATPEERGTLQRSAEDVGLASLPRLRFSRNEAESIVQAAGSKKTLRALDFDANRHAALSDDLREFHVVHFATHGLVDSRHPQLSGLVLSLLDQKGQPQNGFVRLNEIYNLKLDADLVVLSACQTALGREVRGEGLVGMTRGFMYAGARRVVASLWRVDDRATALLMSRFYSNLFAGKKTPSDALRDAQLSMARETRWKNPYYWAAFTLQGDWR